MAKDTTPGERRTLRVLLAEDDRLNRLLAVRLLESEGHTVTAVENGLLAVEAFESGAFDLVLMDLEMPVLDGFDSTRRIRALEEGAENPVAIYSMTSHSDAGALQKCDEAGMTGHIEKPLDSDKVEWVRREVLGINPSASELDRAKILGRFGNNPLVLGQVLEVVQKALPERLADIETGRQEHDAARVSEHAHRLKGNVAHFTPTPAHRTAQELQKAADSEDWSSIDALAVRLGAEVRQLLDDLPGLVAEE